MADLNVDQVYDWVLNAYKKAEEKGLNFTGFLISLVTCLGLSLAVYAVKNGLFNYLKNMFFKGSKPDKTYSPVNPRPEISQDVNIKSMLDEVCDEAFPKDAASYNTFREMITDMGEQKLLRGPIKDLLQELGLESTAPETNTFLKMRADLRFKVFKMKDPINIEEHNVNNLNWEQICQLIEEQVKPSSRQERLEWYKYIEDSQITGALLKNPKESKKIMKVLKLNMGQTENLKKMLKELRGGEDEETGKGGVIMNGGVTGKINAGGIDEHTGDIHVAHTSYSYGYGPKKKKGQEQQNEETDEN